MYAFNASTGTQLWRSEQTHNIVFDLTIAQDTVYFGSQDRWFHAYDLHTGTQLWKRLIGSISEAPTCDGNTIYVSVNDDTASFYGIKALNAASGSEIWSASIPGNTGQPAITHGVVYITSFSLYVFNAQDGTTIWKGIPPAMVDTIPGAYGKIFQIAP